MKPITKLIAGVVFAIVLMYAGSIALRRAEIAECIAWQEQADTLQGFYLTQWQVDQCVAVGHAVILK